MSKSDIYTWISKVIDSCDTVIQRRNCNKLVLIFRAMFNDIELSNKLYNKID